jgi:hypothetical protein
MGGGWYGGGGGGACGNCWMFIKTFCWCIPLPEGCSLETCCARASIGSPVRLLKAFWLA